VPSALQCGPTAGAVAALRCAHVPARFGAAEALAAFAVVLDEVAVAGDVQRAVWFGTPAPSSRARSSCPLRGALYRAIGAEEVDHRVLAGDGVRFDPSGKGKR